MGSSKAGCAPPGQLSKGMGTCILQGCTIWYQYTLYFKPCMLCMFQFRQNRRLWIDLLCTAGTTLVEASPHDTTFGIGVRATHSAATDRSRWRGLNLMGFMLTDMREELRREFHGRCWQQWISLYYIVCCEAWLYRLPLRNKINVFFHNRCVCFVCLFILFYLSNIIIPLVVHL